VRLQTTKPTLYNFSVDLPMLQGFIALSKDI
jgi:hypothetical protein